MNKKIIVQMNKNIVNEIVEKHKNSFNVGLGSDNFWASSAATMDRL